MSHSKTAMQLWLHLCPNIPSEIRREAIIQGCPTWWPLKEKARYLRWYQSPKKDPLYQTVYTVLEQIERGEVTLLNLSEAAYPALLRNSPSPPALVFAKGNIDLLHQPSVAVVGARNCSSQARAVCRRWIPEWSKRGINIVSGLARGVDAEAHVSALNANGSTVAVIAGGINNIYPPQHERLYQRIVESGCLVSETPGNRAPRRHDFPKRNRIISGLSQVTVVVEASIRSGSLITARQALSQGRELAAVPNSPLFEDLQGANELLRQGATPLTTAGDLFELFNEEQLLAQQLVIRVLLAIGPGRADVDELAEHLNCTPNQVFMTLGDLEAQGLVVCRHGLWSQNALVDVSGAMH